MNIFAIIAKNFFCSTDNWFTKVFRVILLQYKIVFSQTFYFKKITIFQPKFLFKFYSHKISNKNFEAYLFPESTVFFCGIRLKLYCKNITFCFRTSNNNRHNSETQKNPLHSSHDKFCSFLFRYHYRPLSPVFCVASQISANISIDPRYSEIGIESRALFSRRTIALSQDIRNANRHQISVSSRIYTYIYVRVATRRAYLLDTASRLRYRHLNVLLPRALERLQEFKPPTSLRPRNALLIQAVRRISHILT